ncbi:MAG: DMT family transporter [Corynebacterium marinum]|uniref:DMT family transporter n=1 Tax=Corynebacterium marinum TaxID=349751 RepID=A0A847HE80_9CORY|nr:DMT family transporter [Corynebacterium marinum]
MFGVLFGILVGLVMPVQTNANSRLRLSVGSPFLASLVSFTVGFLTLLAAARLLDGRLPDPALTAGRPAWLWSGGLLGVVVLTGNIFLFPRLGSVQTVVLPVTGQVIMGLLIDHFGWFNAPQAALGATRILGALLLVSGVLGAIGLADALLRRDRVVGTGSSAGLSLWAWRFAGVVFGMFSATQTAVNGQLGVVLGTATGAALVSFTVGVSVLLLIVLGTRAKWGLGVPAGMDRNPWWMWIGGFLGAAFVFGNAFLSPVIGTGLTVMTILLGMMAGSLLIDHFGLLGARRKPTTLLQALGLACMVAGVAVIRLF